MDARSRSSPKRRKRAAIVSIGDGDGDGGGGVDRISGLSDDLLLRILDLVPKAENVVRTHALLRRWRGLWTGVAALRFDFNSMPKSRSSHAAAERYIDFVNGALALRATAKQPSFVEDLAISFDISRQQTGQLVPQSVEAAQGWIRYALQHELSSVRALKIQMFSHGEYGDEDRNDGTIHLLQCCRLTRSLEVSFEIPKTENQTMDIMKGKIPPLPYVRHLAVHIRLLERHSTGPGIACLLAQCSNVTNLRIQLRYIIAKSLRQRNQSASDLLCDNNSCHWKSQEFSLAHLQKVEFRQLIGTDREFQFIQSILTKASGIQKVTISFDQLYWPKGRKHAFFRLMPQLDGGLWTTCKDARLSYKWRRCQ